AKGCSSILASRPAPPASPRAAALRLTGLRVAGDLAYARYRGPAGPDRFTLLKREGGRWQLALYAPSTLP
ncbi:MAG TPA: hypothetical protein VNY83_01415, partial [Solirubrobacterales bacterium]|nr:hypothetical protein [Solirubrobacterales bacterium]